MDRGSASRPSPFPQRVGKEPSPAVITPEAGFRSNRLSALDSSIVYRLSNGRRAGGITDLDQIEARGPGGGAAGAAVAGGERMGDVVGLPAAQPDQFQGARHVADLVVEEG